MIYFLGGPPRIGKSIIAKAITRQYGINAVSTDSLGVVLEAVLHPEAMPSLFAVSRFNAMPEAERIRSLVENPSNRIDCQIEESTAVWRAVVPFVRREQEEGRDLVTEGVAVLPELVAQLEGVDCRAVFLGNRGLTHKENIKRGAIEHEHDWMRHASDECIAAFASFVVQMSSYIEKEARTYGFDYVEMDGRPFKDVVPEVVDLLLE
jgi:2-phosphoglycerate kinase